MFDKERSIQLSRRKLLQLPATRGIGNLDALARTAEFVAQHPDQALSAAEKFATAIRNIFQPTPKPETPEIFQDRPEQIELSLQDRALNAVTDLLQPHVIKLQEMGLKPQYAIEPLANYLLNTSEVPILRASIILAYSGPRFPKFEIHDILDDPPGGEEISFRESTHAAIRSKSRRYGVEEQDKDPRTLYVDYWQEYSSHYFNLVRNGPYFSYYIPARIVNGKSVEELVKKFQTMNTKNYKYLGTLLPIRE